MLLSDVQSVFVYKNHEGLMAKISTKGDDDEAGPAHIAHVRRRMVEPSAGHDRASKQKTAGRLPAVIGRAPLKLNPEMGGRRECELQKSAMGLRVVLR